MSRYPEIRAGQRITGRMLTGIQFEEVVKQAATTRGSNTTLAPDPDLQFTLEANATYHVEFFVQYISSSVANLATSWGVPAGATGIKRRIGGSEKKFDGTTQNNSNSAGAWTDVAIVAHNLDSAISYGDRPGGSQTWLYECGSISTSSSGVLSFNWAQEVSDSFDTEVSAFSYARLKRVS